MIMIKDIRKLLLHVSSTLNHARNNIAIRAFNPSYSIKRDDSSYTLPPSDFQTALNEQATELKALRDATSNYRKRTTRPSSGFSPGIGNPFFDQVRPPSRAVSSTPTISLQSLQQPTTTTTVHNSQTPTSDQAIPFELNLKPNPNTKYYQGRGSFAMVCFRVAPDFQQQLRQLHSRSRLSYPFSSDITYHNNTQTGHPVLCGPDTTARPSYSKFTSKECNRRNFPNRSNSSTRLLQLPFCHSEEEQRHTPSFQLTQAQRIHGPVPFQDGNDQRSRTSYCTQRLFSVDRLNRCFSSFRHPFRFTQVPSFCWKSINGVPLHLAFAPYHMSSLRFVVLFSIGPGHNKSNCWHT
ncbi:hypothetical protein BDF20DRAFT_942965 [Mycotypha africana]|uniref:uncharacterized protein n=1 Tax=Mycotypha africana TaxID=64632 RepID=UPI00230193D0|nr:uncharacterized protein BDF20DRAFT_942965 [Mycotypha africana]KAI8977694.1 hypothetical protein BDF20DRAFT_942965 [Mycotypha africana]